MDTEGAVLGPDRVLVRRTSRGFRGMERRNASILQKSLFDVGRDDDWLFRQAQRIAEALDRGEIALAQIYGLHIPLRDLDDRQLRDIAVASLVKGYNPNEPRLPKGDPNGGEWTTGGDASVPGTPTNSSGSSTSGAEDGEGGGNSPSAPELSAVPLSDSPSSDNAANHGDGSTSSPPMRFDWGPPIDLPTSNSPRGDDADRDSNPSTLGSSDVGNDSKGSALSTEDTGPSEGGSSQQELHETPPPEIPTKEPTTTQQRNAALRAVATWLGRALAILGPAFQLDPRVRMVFAAIEAAGWIADYLPKVLSYLDQPKTLEELQNAVGEGGSGYETHHIVEAQKRSTDPQSNSRRFPDWIDARENLVRVPYWKHVEISSWYSKPNKKFDRLSPRDFLRGKSWVEQYRVGIETLRDFGVLK